MDVRVLTYAEQVEPWCVIVVHYFGTLNDANGEDRPDEPPDVECDLTAQVPAEIFANTLTTGDLLVEVRLFVFVLRWCLEDAQALLLVSVAVPVSLREVGVRNTFKTTYTFVERILSATLGEFNR